MILSHKPSEALRGSRDTRLDQPEGKHRTTHCEAPTCSQSTRERKPYCSAHLDRLDYYRRVSEVYRAYLGMLAGEIPIDPMNEVIRSHLSIWGRYPPGTWLSMGLLRDHGLAGTKELSQVVRFLSKAGLIEIRTQHNRKRAAVFTRRAQPARPA